MIVGVPPLVIVAIYNPVIYLSRKLILSLYFSLNPFNFYHHSIFFRQITRTPSPVFVYYFREIALTPSLVFVYYCREITLTPSPSFCI